MVSRSELGMLAFPPADEALSHCCKPAGRDPRPSSQAPKR